MDDYIEKDYTFSQGFKEDLAVMIELCIANNTDGLSFEIDTPKGKLEVDFSFKVTPKEEDDGGMDKNI